MSHAAASQGGWASGKAVKRQKISGKPTATPKPTDGGEGSIAWYYKGCKQALADTAADDALRCGRMGGMITMDPGSNNMIGLSPAGNAHVHGVAPFLEGDMNVWVDGSHKFGKADDKCKGGAGVVMVSGKPDAASFMYASMPVYKDDIAAFMAPNGNFRDTLITSTTCEFMGIWLGVVSVLEHMLVWRGGENAILSTPKGFRDLFLIDQEHPPPTRLQSKIDIVEALFAAIDKVGASECAGLEAKRWMAKEYATRSTKGKMVPERPTTQAMPPEQFDATFEAAPGCAKYRERWDHYNTRKAAAKAAGHNTDVFPKLKSIALESKDEVTAFIKKWNEQHVLYKMWQSVATQLRDVPGAGQQKELRRYLAYLKEQMSLFNGPRVMKGVNWRELADRMETLRNCRRVLGNTEEKHKVRIHLDNRTAEQWLSRAKSNGDPDGEYVGLIHRYHEELFNMLNAQAKFHRDKAADPTMKGHAPRVRKRPQLADLADHINMLVTQLESLGCEVEFVLFRSHVPLKQAMQNSDDKRDRRVVLFDYMMQVLVDKLAKEHTV